MPHDELTIIILIIITIIKRSFIYIAHFIQTAAQCASQQIKKIFSRPGINNSSINARHVR